MHEYDFFDHVEIIKQYPADKAVEIASHHETLSFANGHISEHRLI